MPDSPNEAAGGSRRLLSFIELQSQSPPFFQIHFLGRFAVAHALAKALFGVIYGPPVGPTTQSRVEGHHATRVKP